jgi:hypothetical protein
VPRLRGVETSLENPTRLPKCPLPGGWAELPLGQTFDEAIARDLRAAGHRVGRSTITRARHVLGIPTFVPSKLPKPKPRRRIDWNALPLGVIFDLLLAKHLGVTHPAVLHQRRTRGIPAAQRSPENALLGAVQRRPGLHLRSYAAHLDAPVKSAAHSLILLGLITTDPSNTERLLPIINPKSTTPKTTATSTP